MGFMEDDYEEPQTLLNMALEDCSESIVNEIWKVKHLQITKNHLQFVILLSNGSYYCTCLYLIYAGFVCRHFFAVMIHSKKSQFNIKLVPSRWYSNEGLVAINEIQEPSICIIQNENESLLTGTFQVLENIVNKMLQPLIKIQKEYFMGMLLDFVKKL